MYCVFVWSCLCYFIFSGAVAVNVTEGMLQLVVMDNFEFGQQRKFCALIPSDIGMRMRVLTNVAPAHCISGAHVELDLSDELSSRNKLAEVPSAKHNTVIAVKSANRIQISSPYSLESNYHSGSSRSRVDDPIDKQLDQMVLKLSGATNTPGGPHSIFPGVHSPGRNHSRRLAVPTGIKSVLLVRITLADDSVDAWCNETCTFNTIWGPDYSASVSFHQSSYSILELDSSQKAMRTVTLSTSVSSYSGCNFDLLGDDALSKLTSEGFVHSTFDMVQFFMPRNIDCWFGGVAYVHGRLSWIRQLGGQTVTHELGHNFGVYHASSDDNNDNAMDLEYGDYSAVMGGPTARRHDVRTFNAIHRAIYGWITVAEFAEFACGSGRCLQTYNLHDLQTSPSDVNSAGGVSMIGSEKDSSRYYYISYRAGTGLDANNEPQFQDAVFVHYYSSTETNSFLVIAVRTGETYAARVGTSSVLLITVLSTANGVAVVKLEYDNNVPCVDINAELSDSANNGWSLNYLRLKSSNYELVAVTLPSGGSYSASMCLPPGNYTPYCCGGSAANEVSWTLTGDPIIGSVVGGALSSCSDAQDAANERILIEVDPPTQSPTSSVPSSRPSQFPTLHPTATPTVTPTPAPSAKPTSVPTLLPSTKPTGTPNVCGVNFSPLRVTTTKRSGDPRRR